MPVTDDFQGHSPIRAQYLSIKKDYPDALIFFRLGDFYETFDTDAEIASRELDLTLTKREWGRGERSPMAGAPHHTIDSYIAKLIERGYRVAVVEQVTEPNGKGLVQREVTRVVTPGAVIDPSMLAAQRNNYLAAIITGKDAVGVAYADVSTGEFACAEIAATDIPTTLAQEMARIMPMETLVEAPAQAKLDPRALRSVPDDELASAGYDETLPPWAKTIGQFTKHFTPLDSSEFNEQQARRRLLEHFHIASLEAFGCNNLPLAVRAAGAIIGYLSVTQRGLLEHLTSLETYSTEQFMLLDPYTRRNLELFENNRDRSAKGSLVWALDQTRTAMGGRLLRKWMGQPLIDIAALHIRLDAVEYLFERALTRAKLIQALAKIGDLERLANRVIMRAATPRDLAALKESLRGTQELLINGLADELVVGPLSQIVGAIDPCEDCAAFISQALTESPPITVTEGGIIRAGYSAELDDINNRSQGAREWIAALESKERSRTGITNLKVGFNKVFGYFLEVSSSNIGKVPKEYIRKQTITNGERYITPELKEYETLVLNAQERCNKLENELFIALRETIAQKYAQRIIETGKSIAALDALQSFAEIAQTHSYCRPELTNDLSLHITAGRHPVIERTMADIPFVPNDIQTNADDAQIILITGPNMSGKSTIMRQTALIALMAQMGSFVPAEKARIGIVDRIFTRIGAQDDLATGQSTFMVEMVETANILRNATRKSLVVLDEIGRGTSTYDGLAIARAVVEYLHQHPRCGARTLFATHYHELVELAAIYPNVRPFSIAVTEENGAVVFLRRLIAGGADRSYGVHVAQLAGIPEPVIRRAKEILEELEQKDDSKKRRRAMRDAAAYQPTIQLSLFTPAQPENPIMEELLHLQVDELSPREALDKLYELQKTLRDQKLQ